MLSHLLETRKPESQLEADVHRALVETLYASLNSLVMGVLVGAMMSGFVAYETKNYYLISCSLSIFIVGLFRIISFIYVRKHGSEKYRILDIIHETGAIFYAFLIGLNSFLVIINTLDFKYIMICVTLNVSYSTSISVRNAGNPDTTIKQIIIIAFPQFIAFLFLGNLFGYFMSILNLGLMGSSINIVVANFNTLKMAFVEKYEKVELAKQYQMLASSDPLTGLDNRHVLNAHLQELLNTPVAKGQSIAVYWIDLDHFKQINDALGHGVGDQILCEAANRLRQIAGTDGHVSRFGGDEFIVIKQVPHLLSATRIAEKITDSLSLPFTSEWLTLDMSGSVGLALGQAGMISAEDLMRNADMALYEAKGSGRRSYCVFHQAMADKLTKYREMEQDLRAALNEKQFVLHYQPIVDLQSRAITSYEALIRWHHPVHGLISPGDFIGTAEEIKMIEPITQWVVEQACKDAMAWPEHMRVAVNISPSLLKGRILPPIIHTALLNSGLSPKRLCLEITETMLIEDDVNSLILLKEFQKLGISLSLDDFGTGYSSLSYVCKYAFNTLKIDRSFVTDLKQRTDTRAVVNAVVGLGKSLDIKVVAEGIETEEQCAYIKEIGCQYGQGYLFGKAEPMERIAHLAPALGDTLLSTQPLRGLKRA